MSMKMLSTEVVKVIVLFALMFLTFLLGILPIKLVKVARKRTASQARDLSNPVLYGTTQETRTVYQRVISFLSCFAAGVFLATCLLDLLPDVRKDLMNVMDIMKIYTGFPVAEFVMVIGLFAILITEQIVLTVKERHHNRNDDRRPLLADGNWDKTATESIHSAMEGISDRPYNEQDDRRSQTSEISRANDLDSGLPGSVEQHQHHSEEVEHPHSPLRAFLLLIALSLHSIFEGLAVGLQSDVSNVLGIFAALILHKSILSFSLGMSLVQTNLSTKSMLRSIIFFSVTAPIGIAIGIGIINLWDSTVSALIQGLLQGIACGTFLYITFFEVLPHEFNSHHDRMLKVLFLLLGYSTVTGILFIGDSVRKPFCPVINTNGTKV